MGKVTFRSRIGCPNARRSQALSLLFFTLSLSSKSKLVHQVSIAVCGGHGFGCWPPCLRHIHGRGSWSRPPRWPTVAMMAFACTFGRQRPRLWSRSPRHQGGQPSDLSAVGWRDCSASASAGEGRRSIHSRPSRPSARPRPAQTSQ